MLCLLVLQALPGLASGQLFSSITADPVVTMPSGSRSANFLDFNRDDFQDILITNGKSGGENNFLYRNNRDGSFSLVQDTVTQDGTPSDGATCGDFDNDGFVDVYTVNWYDQDNLLYQNNGGNGFIRLGNGQIAQDGGYSETAAWADMDGDGLLDLYTTNSGVVRRNFLYLNTGGGNFVKASGIAPATDNFYSRCVNWIDFDMDGDQDLFVANENNETNNLYRNDGYPNFTSITTGSLVTSSFSSHSSSWADVDNDGDFDVLVANYQQANQLFRNDGNGNFSMVPNAFGSDIGCSFSSSFADYDNDGDLDLFITNGFCQQNLENFLYENDGAGNFSRNMTEPMATDLGGSYGCAWGDYDNDGFQDLLVANWQGDQQTNALYHNNGNANHWLALRLTGTVSNRSAIGARVRARAVIGGNTVWQLREVSAQTGYCSQNSLIVHFGLGDATTVDSLEITWPSGIVQQFASVDADHLYKLVENDSIGLVGAMAPQPRTPGIELFPNPSDGDVRIQIAGDHRQPIELALYTSDGRQLYAAEVPVGRPDFRLPLRGQLPAGTYLLRLSDGAGYRLSRRVIIRPAR